MTALARIAHWLQCPVCGEDLTLSQRTLDCTTGHRFDIARQGYVNLLGQASPRNADTAEMVAARERFLGASWYRPIADAVIAAVAGCRRLVEVGAGPGHYLTAALTSGLVPDDALGLAIDVSVPACKRAARAHPALASVVANTWARLPVSDDIADALLCIFAPRNINEFRRVLSENGRMVFVVPNFGHLHELRKAYGLLDIDDHKAEQVASWLHSPTITRVCFCLNLTSEAASDLVAMGPNAFHSSAPVSAICTTADVSVVVGTC